MTRFARRVCSIGCVALVLSAFALTIMVIPSGAFGLTFTTIDVPGTTDTGVAGINAAGPIVGGYTDAGGTGHGFLATP